MYSLYIMYTTIIAGVQQDSCSEIKNNFHNEKVRLQPTSPNYNNITIIVYTGRIAAFATNNIIKAIILLFF